MKRRLMLKTLVGAAVSGALIDTPYSFAEGKSGLPHAEIVTQARAVVAVDRRRAQLARLDPDSTEALRLKAEVTHRVDRLLGVMLAKFASNGDPDAIQEVMDRRGNLDVLDEPRLRVIADGVVPVAVMRELCYVHRINFNPSACKNWLAFVSRYSTALLDS